MSIPKSLKLPSQYIPSLILNPSLHASEYNSFESYSDLYSRGLIVGDIIPFDESPPTNTRSVTVFVHKRMLVATANPAAKGIHLLVRDFSTESPYVNTRITITEPNIAALFVVTFSEINLKTLSYKYAGGIIQCR